MTVSSYVPIDTITLQGHRSHGVPKRTVVELVEGNLAEPSAPPASASSSLFWVDLLLVSAFPNDYTETPTSLIGSLARRQGISIRKLARDKQEDLRQTLQCWISHPLAKDTQGSSKSRIPYRQIMVWEPVGTARHVVPAVESIFASIIAMAPKANSVAMPILGSGDRGLNQYHMLRAILYATRKWVCRGLPLQKMFIFMYRKDSSLIRFFETVKGELLALEGQAVDKIPDELKPAEETQMMDAEPKKDLYRSNSTIMLSFARRDQALADLASRALKLLIDNPSVIVVAEPAVLDTEDVTQSAASKRRLLDVASQVIALITPNYVRELGCLDEFNECLLEGSEETLLQPVLVQNSALPKYIQLIQYHDARPGNIDSLFPVLVSIMKKVATSNRLLLQNRMVSSAVEVEKDESASSSSNDQAEPPVFDVFISYAQKLGSQAKAALEILQFLKPDIKCFIDVNELQAGGRWQDAIYSAIDRSKVIFLVLTPAFYLSAFCREEAAIAALKSKEGQVILATEPIPVADSAKSVLPKAVLDALIPNETLFQSCERVVATLNKPQEPPTYIDTRPYMHEIQMQTLNAAKVAWDELVSEDSAPNTPPTLCLIGHKDELPELRQIEALLNCALRTTTEPTPARIMLSSCNDVHFIDAATIMVNVISPKFLSSAFCMNAVAMGLLRNRLDGGYHIPVLLKPLDPASTPTFLRLVPKVDATNCDLSGPCPNTATFVEALVATSRLANIARWKDRTTVVAMKF